VELTPLSLLSPTPLVPVRLYEQEPVILECEEVCESEESEPVTTSVVEPAVITSTTQESSAVEDSVPTYVSAPTPVTLFKHMHESGDASVSTASNTYCTSYRSEEVVDRVVDRAVDEVVVLQGPDWVVTEADYADYRSAFVDISSDEELEEGELRD